MNTFDFIGALSFSRNGAVKENTFDSGWTKVSLQASVQESKANSMFITLEGGYHKAKDNKVYSFTKGLFGEKGNALVIDWDERFETNVHQIADFKKIVVDLTENESTKEKYYELRKKIREIEVKENPSDEDTEKLAELYKQMDEEVPNRKEFITEYDAIQFLAKHAEELKGKKFRVRGEIVSSYWNGKFYTSYNAKSFELVPEEYVNKLEGQVDLFFTKDSLDKSSAKSERKFYMETYLKQFSREHDKDVFFPYNTIFNFQQHDDENKKHKLHIQMIETEFTKKGKAVFTMPFVLKFVNGAEVKEVEASDLTPQQQMMVEIGMAEPKDFMKQTFGERVSENRIHFPVYKGDFANGAVETDYDVDDLKYVPVIKNDKEASSKVEEKPKKATVVDEDVFDFSELPF